MQPKRPNTLGLTYKQYNYFKKKREKSDNNNNKVGTIGIKLES